MLRWLGLILTVTFLIVLLLPTRTSAQSVYNLQSDINQLRAQVSLLQSQVAQISRQGGAPASQPAPRTSSGTPYISDRQMLDRLAVLAIEAKDRMNALEQRIARLEKRS